MSSFVPTARRDTLVPAFTSGMGNNRAVWASWFLRGIGVFDCNGKFSSSHRDSCLSPVATGTSMLLIRDSCVRLI
jgi:hypothetical protein